MYNLGLETKQVSWASAKVNLSRFDLTKQLTELKQECTWLKDVNAQSLQQSIANLDSAYSNYFNGHSYFPKFKKKTTGGSFNVPQDVYIKNNKLSIPKFRDGISINIHRPIKGTIKQATISRTPTGKYFASILCETGEDIKPKVKITDDTTVGIDLGLKSFIVSSDGKEYSNPKFLRKAESKLKYIQRKYSKYKGKRTKQKLALLHEKVAKKRKDFLHKVSSELIKNHDSLAIETLRVSNMLKDRKLSKSISDAGWRMFVDMLDYKAEWYGKNILRIGTFEPSSKTCSCCGHINKDLQLKDREWACKSCGTLHNRDLNAAINIRNFAINNMVSGIDTKNQNELPKLLGVMTFETTINSSNPSSHF